ncbi:MAG: DNA polymerase III subunit gamma/tau [Methylomicrobium sp.]|nr:DNA polymerase III subunit gamma/tau [Methylomicrobium sp.]
MTYQVLARKWRPRNFSEIVGQEHVVNSLINALKHNRLHHAYLFTGTRGVGKTTIARILAKAINCEARKDYNPCGQCNVCIEVDQGRYPDLIEVDAASRTKVDDTRDLLENTQYAPSSGRYKVYLIDEVHMLSGHSFNALLKTLEEPPEHVKFLLATTDPHKIPVTVLSRCLQFNLKSMLPDQVFLQMETILQKEAIEAESPALRMLARAADGSMRDGLSLLDQAIVFGNGRVNLDDVTAMLGTVAQQPVDNLINALVERDALKLFQVIDALSDLTPDFGDVLQRILLVLHKIALYQVAPSAVKNDFDLDSVVMLAEKISPEEVQLYYQIVLIGQRDLPLAPDPRSGFEMVMLRLLTFQPAVTEKPTPSSQVASVKDNRQPIPQETIRSVSASSVQETLKVPEPVSQEKPVTSDSIEWSDLVVAIKIRGMTREFANNCVLRNISDTVCKLELDTGHKHLLSPKIEDNLQKALQDYFAKPIRLVIQTGEVEAVTPAMKLRKEREDLQQNAVDSINNDEAVAALKERFDARVVPGTIEPAGQ